jgi:hypothetical protein
MDNRRTLGIEAHNLKLMWQQVVSQFTSDLYGHHIDRKQAERSYDRFEVAVEQFMHDATAAGYFSKIAGPEEGEVKRRR